MTSYTLIVPIINNGVFHPLLDLHVVCELQDAAKIKVFVRL
jgi:hypothetical protein